MARTYDLLDHLHDGKFAERLRQLRADGQSLRQIRQLLEDEGQDVSVETVRRWCIEVGAEQAS